MPSKRTEPIMALNQLVSSLFKKPKRPKRSESIFKLDDIMNSMFKKPTRRRTNKNSTNSQRRAANRIEKHLQNELIGTTKTRNTIRRNYEEGKREQIVEKIKQHRKRTAKLGTNI